MTERELRMRQELQRRQRRARGMGEDSSSGGGGSATDLYRNIQSTIPQSLMPGNVGDINRMIWPFWFTFQKAELVPNMTQTKTFVVSQEACFIAMAFTKTVFEKTEGPVYTAIDPSQATTVGGESSGLKFQFRDGQSTRAFSQTVISLDPFGDPRFPSVFQTPIMFLPNSTVECVYSNSDADRTYVAFITMFGYRVRLENAEQILSLVEG